MTGSIVGGIQPGKLQHYIDGACAGGEGADGLLQRFQLLVWPDRIGPWKPADRWGDKTARDAAYAVFKKLDAMSPDQVGAYGVGDESCPIPYLMFTPEAQRLWDQRRTDLENRVRADGLDHAPRSKPTSASIGP